MIEESLLKSGILGKDGFVWWIGRVAHRNYWYDENLSYSLDGKMGQRCKVRIIGYHPFDRTLKEDELPWAHVLMDPISGSGQGGRGSTMALVGGETCVGFFLDGEEGQQPVIIGLLHRSEEVKNSASEDEIKAEESSQFKPFTGHPGNIVAPTKRTALSTNPGTSTVAVATTSATTQTGESSVHLKNADSSFAAQAFEKITTKTFVNPSTCRNDLIGGITRILNDFIAIVNGLERSFGQFVDPILNEIVNITSTIKNIAGQIGGIIKQIINNIRSSIIKCLVSLFKKFLGIQKKTNPTHPITTPAAQKATKTLIEQIFCILENLIDEIIDFISKMLENMIGNTYNIPFCAAEQFVSGILAKLMDMIEKAIQPIISGVQWLSGGISNIKGLLGQVSTLATQIYNYIGCDDIKCTQPSEWISSTSVALQKASDDWGKQVKNINVFRGIGNDLSQISSALSTGENQNQSYNGSSIISIIQTASALGGNLNSIEGAIATISVFGSQNNEFDSCNKSTSNPQTQYELSPVPIGYKFSYCIPPITEVFGDGSGAKLVPIVSNGSIFSIEVVNGGLGYSSPLSIAIIDNSGYGTGARAEAIIENGVIVGAVILSGGSGYCPGNYSGIGLSTTSPTTGITSSIVGIITSIYVSTPGVGYQPEDTISIGTTTFTPVKTPNGSFVEVKLPTNFNQSFTSSPTITINTNTGVGAKLIPIMKYIPQGTFVNENVKINIDQDKVINVVDCINGK